MEAIKVVIQSLEDAENGKPILVGSENLEEAESLTIGILEKGTVGGQTSLMFLLTNKDGSISMAQMTANQLEMFIGAFRGAVQRFGK